MPKYYAVRSEAPIDKTSIIADGYTYAEVSEKAIEILGWKHEPGSVAPYSIVSANWFGEEK